MSPRFFSLWAINAELDPARLHAQLEVFASHGLDGVVFHPRSYAGSSAYLGEEYLAILSDVIVRAKELDLAFWIYDENGWPSGTADGRIPQEFPHLRQRWLSLVEGSVADALSEIDRDGSRWSFIENQGAGVDHLNPELAQRFLSITYEGYRRGLSPEAFGHVEAFFDDEPEFGLGLAHEHLSPHGSIPWSPALPQRYSERYGRDLIADLPRIFFGEAEDGVALVSGSSGGLSDARVRFWELLTDLFGENYLSPIDAWCRAHGKIFTAHMKGEEHPLFQIPTVGSLSRVSAHLSLPGIDALERRSSNDFFPRLVSSASRQFGSGRVMAEAFGGAGWGATPADLERYLLRLGSNGCTDFVLHLSQYRLDSAAIVDWPPSHPLHSTWGDVYSQVIDRVRRGLTDEARPSAELLIVVPQRAIMRQYEPSEFSATNVHDARSYPDSPAARLNDRFMVRVAALREAGVNFDLCDERTFESQAVRDGGAVRVGAATYQRVAAVDPEDIRGELREFVGDIEAADAAEADASARHRAPRHVDRNGAHDDSVALDWTFAARPQNDLLLECTRTDSGSYKGVARFDLIEPIAIDAIFADELVWLRVDGKPLDFENSTEGARLRLAVDADAVEFEFLVKSLLPDGVKPFVWLRGDFIVKSLAAFSSVGRTAHTAGPFIMKSATTELSGDLLRDGFPFIHTSLQVFAEFEVAQPSAAARLSNLIADAVSVRIDGGERRWAWGSEIALVPGEGQRSATWQPGSHRIELEVIPNGFNHFGPHHYYRGDPRVVSPAQMVGTRNFVDAVDAPIPTHQRGWHFRPFQLPTHIEFDPPLDRAAAAASSRSNERHQR